jgi:hypothetical protein
MSNKYNVSMFCAYALSYAAVAFPSELGINGS